VHNFTRLSKRAKTADEMVEGGPGLTRHYHQRVSDFIAPDRQAAGYTTDKKPKVYLRDV
jgi:hypothetical protein